MARAPTRPVPPQADLWKMFNYHSDGYLIWKIKPAKNTNIGDRAGPVNKDGYTQIMVNGVRYLAHRLIYQFFKGDLDHNMVVDHIDGNPRNNRFSNLDQITQQQNIQKKKQRVDNTSGLTGIYYRSGPQHHLSPWLAQYFDESGKRIGKSFNNKYAAYHFYAENSARVMGKFYVEKPLSVEDRHAYIDWLIEESDKENQDLFKLAA